MLSLVDDQVAPTTADNEKTYYESGGGRKTFYALSFILLLPFFISLPVMLAQRIMKGVWLDTWGLMVLAAGFTIIMGLVLFELVFSLRAKVDLGSKAVAFTLPAGGGGLTPTLFYQSRTIPYEDIATIQSFCDCYGGAVAPVVLRGTRLILKTGERIPLGFVNDADDDPRFPFTTIAHQIARRAGVEVDDIGHIRYALHKRMFGIKHAGDGMPPEDVAGINRQHNVFLIGIVIVMAALLVLGIGNDFMQSSGDRGERAVTQPLIR
ncbi:MAG: hypothetical protein KDK91_21370 [Gammaproteobacteria bacterium]|nr:hypothetical protein [Gammaproteobacteria bacterium]